MPEFTGAHKAIKTTDIFKGCTSLKIDNSIALFMSQEDALNVIKSNNKVIKWILK